MGTVENIAKAKSCIMSGRYVNSSGSWKKPFRMMLSGGKVRSEMDVQPGIMSVTAFDGTMAWNIQPWSGSLEPQPMNKSAQMNLALNSELLNNDLLSYKQKETRLELKDKEEIDGSDCFKIVAYRKDGVIREYYLDVDSYLIVKIVTKMTVDGEEEESTTYYSNYRKVNGVMLPFASESQWGGGFFIERYDFTTTINESLFSMPAKPQPKPATNNGM